MCIVMHRFLVVLTVHHEQKSGQTLARQNRCHIIMTPAAYVAAILAAIELLHHVHRDAPLSRCSNGASRAEIGPNSCTAESLSHYHDSCRVCSSDSRCIRAIASCA